MQPFQAGISRENCKSALNSVCGEWKPAETMTTTCVLRSRHWAQDLCFIGGKVLVIFIIKMIKVKRRLWACDQPQKPALGYKASVPCLCEVSIRAVLFQGNNFKYLSQGQDPWTEAVQVQPPEHRRRDQDRGITTRKTSKAPVCVPRTILAFCPKTRVQCVSRPALCPGSTLSYLSYRLFPADFLWCGFGHPPAEKSLKSMCHISWAHVRTTNIKLKHYHQCPFFPLLLKDAKNSFGSERQPVSTNPQKRAQVWVTTVWRKGLDLDLSQYVSWRQTVEAP